MDYADVDGKGDDNGRGGRVGFVDDEQRPFDMFPSGTGANSWSNDTSTSAAAR
jgi:hypothetical protein